MSLSAHRPVNRRAALLVTLLICSVGLAVKVYAARTMPTHPDAVFYLNIGSHYIERGGLTPYMWRLPDDSNIIAGSGTGYGILLLVTWLDAFGLTFGAGRALMLLLGVVNALVMVGFVRTWHNRTAGIIAGALFVVSTTPFFSFQLRMDAPGMLAYTLVLWLHVWAVKHGRLWAHFGVGVGLVAAAEFHILAVMYIGGVTFYYVADLLWGGLRGRAWRWQPFAAYAAGGAIAGALYIAVHVLPNPEAYFLIAQDCPACEPAGLAKEISRYGTFFRSRPFEVLLLIAAVIVALVRRRRQDAHFLLLLAGGLIAYAVVSPPPQVEYIIHLAPLYLAGVAAMFASERPAPRRVLAAQSALILLLAMNIYRVNLLANIPKGSYPPVEQIRALDVPRDTVIMGEFRWYGELLDYPNYLQYGTGEERYGMVLRGETLDDLLAREQPQVFIGTPDDALQPYFAAHDFQRVMDDLWFSGAMCGRYPCDDIATAP